MGLSVEQIAKQRSLVISTIYGHLEQAIQAGEPIDFNRLWTPEQELEMTAAFAKTGFGNLTGAKELLGDVYDYGRLRLFRAVHGKTEIPPFRQGNTYCMNQLALNPTVILRRRRICAQVENSHGTF